MWEQDVFLFYKANKLSSKQTRPNIHKLGITSDLPQHPVKVDIYVQHGSAIKPVIMDALFMPMRHPGTDDLLVGHIIYVRQIQLLRRPK